jgi:hypothetical protein
MQQEKDKLIANRILSLIKEEETQNDVIKRQSMIVPNIAAADALDSNGVAAEQSFNREQVQEQEQVCHFFFNLLLLFSLKKTK